MKTFRIQDNDISDGYHTFDELYQHRCLLFLNICVANKNSCFWKPDFEGWLCLYWESPTGQISYHIPNKFKPIVEKLFERDDNHVWDGHKSGDVIVRLIEGIIP